MKLTRSPSTVARGAAARCLPLRGSTVQPLDEVAGRARGQPRRRACPPPRRPRSASSPAACSSPLAGSGPSSGTPAQHAAALLGHEHGVERAEPRAAAVLVDQQPGPAGLDRGRPQVGQRAALERLAGRLDRLARARARRARPRAGTPARREDARFMRLRPPSPWRAAR